MKTNHALVWIDHRSAQVIHFDREMDEVTTVTSKHGNEHLHHKAKTVGDGNSKSHPDYFIDVVNQRGVAIRWLGCISDYLRVVMRPNQKDFSTLADS